MYQLTHYNQQNQNFFTNCQNSWQYILIDTPSLRKVFVKSDKEASGAVDRVACVARLTHLVIADLSVSRQRYRDHCVNLFSMCQVNCQSFRQVLCHLQRNPERGLRVGGVARVRVLAWASRQGRRRVGLRQAHHGQGID